MDDISIPEITDNPAINISLDTIKIGKQALVFCNTRKSAEANAEKIALLMKSKNPELLAISESVLKALSSPTRQCHRLATCVKNGIAFHHAGLAAKQREIVEEGFKAGKIKIICATPTLAMGVNMPAFRTIIKDLKRYGGRWGMEWIPALEYHQMAGRAGRPDFNDEYGEAICIADSETEAEKIVEEYIRAPPEKIISKLAAEPALRTYCLSLVAGLFARSKPELAKFFEKTFYGREYGDMQQIEKIIIKIISQLEEWEFLKSTGSGDFVTASDLGIGKLEATPLGERVAELYLDPWTAFFIITALRRAEQKQVTEFSFINLACSTLELRPLQSVRTSEIDKVEEALSEHSSELIILEPSLFEPDYDEFLKAFKLSLALAGWMDEKNEDEIFEGYNLPPGELHLKRDLCDWILYSADELCQLLSFRELQKTIRKARFRLEKGVKEELISLARIRNIGRIRARLLFRNGIKDIGDIKKTDTTKLKQLLGEKTALALKKDVGQEIKEVPEGRRKGQTSVERY